MPSPSRNIALMLAFASLCSLPIVSGCLDRDKSTSESAAAAPMAARGDALPPPGAASRAMKITLDLSLQTTSVDESVTLLRGAVDEAGGYVSNAHAGGEGKRRSGEFEAKVPVDQLDVFRASLAAAGHVVNESQRAEDVTEQRADLKARVRNARAQEKRLLDLLSDRTGSLADVLAAEKALAEVREQVERLEAQEATLEGHIAYATVKVRLMTITEAPATTVGDKLGRALSNGLSATGDVLLFVLVAFVAAAPMLMVFAVFGYVFYRLGRRVRRLWKTRPIPRVV